METNPATTLELIAGRQLVELPSGTRLECDVAHPRNSSYTSSSGDSGSSRCKLAVCLHPWSRLGGQMEDQVLKMLVKPLNKHEYHVLRYNSRGVGKSSGWASFTGIREAQDLRELVQWAVERLGQVSSIVLIGYSYGSLIAALHPPLDEPKVSHILLSYPIGVRHWLTAFHGGTHTSALNSLVRDTRANVLVMYGDLDDFSSVKTCEEWIRGLHNAVDSSDPDSAGKLHVVKVEGADHFWRERHARTKLIEIIESWLP